MKDEILISIKTTSNSHERWNFEISNYKPWYICM